MSDEIIKAATDMVLLTQDAPQQALHVLLVLRANDCDAYPGTWALPGGHWDKREQPEEAGWRELGEEAGITRTMLHDERPDRMMWWPSLIGVYADPDRDPRPERHVTWAYGMVVRRMYPPTAGDDAQHARWQPVADILTGTLPMAFDHRQIVIDAVEALLPSQRQASWFRSLIKALAHQWSEPTEQKGKENEHR
jgi:8-oxo-dGTP diphosphatase